GLKFDRANFGAILLLLRALLAVFIVFELTLHAGGFFVEEIGEAPEKIGEVGFEAGVLESPGKDVEQVRDGAFEPAGVRQRTRVGFACGWLVAVKLQILDNAGGCRAVMSGFVKIGVDVVKSRHGLSSLSDEPPLAALMARLLPEARAGAAPRGEARGRSAAEENKRSVAVALRPPPLASSPPSKVRGRPPPSGGTM